MQIAAKTQLHYEVYSASKAAFKAEILLEIEKNAEKYRDWYSSRIEAGQRPPSVLAEGDSWFRYAIGFGVIYCLEHALNIETLNLAWPSDDAHEMLSGLQRAIIIRELKKGPAPGIEFDYFFFSGGGNDLIGKDVFYKWLYDWEEGMTAETVINDATLLVAFRRLENDYLELIELRNRYSPSTVLVFHSYDFAIPNGKAACDGKFGPWLQPGLIQRNIPAEERREVVRIFLSKFHNLLMSLSTRATGIVVIPTQGTLRDDQWENEIHPTPAGFVRIAELFATTLNLS